MIADKTANAFLVAIKSTPWKQLSNSPRHMLALLAGVSGASSSRILVNSTWPTKLINAISTHPKSLNSTESLAQILEVSIELLNSRLIRPHNMHFHSLLDSITQEKYMATLPIEELFLIAEWAYLVGEPGSRDKVLYYIVTRMEEIDPETTLECLHKHCKRFIADPIIAPFLSHIGSSIQTRKVISKYTLMNLLFVVENITAFPATDLGQALAFHSLQHLPKCEEVETSRIVSVLKRDNLLPSSLSSIVEPTDIPGKVTSIADDPSSPTYLISLCNLFNLQNPRQMNSNELAMGFSRMKPHLPDIIPQLNLTEVLLLARTCHSSKKCNAGMANRVVLNLIGRQVLNLDAEHGPSSDTLVFEICSILHKFDGLSPEDLLTLQPSIELSARYTSIDYFIKYAKNIILTPLSLMKCLFEKMDPLPDSIETTTIDTIVDLLVEHEAMVGETNARQYSLMLYNYATKYPSQLYLSSTLMKLKCLTENEINTCLQLSMDALSLSKSPEPLVPIVFHPDTRLSNAAIAELSKYPNAFSP